MSTPRGDRCHTILLLRKDIAEKLEVGHQESPKGTIASKKKFTLFPPGWKPAPGFTDLREEKE